MDYFFFFIAIEEKTCVNFAVGIKLSALLLWCW